VLVWLDSLEISKVATTAVTATELRYGVARLPEGHRKRELTVIIRGILTEDFYGRVLPFDERASVRYADIVTGRERIGQPTGRSRPSAATWTPPWPPATRRTSRKRESNSSIPGGSADPAPDDKAAPRPLDSKRISCGASNGRHDCLDLLHRQRWRGRGLTRHCLGPQSIEQEAELTAP
jgi:hypothetical protein